MEIKDRDVLKECSLLKIYFEDLLLRIQTFDLQNISNN